MTTDTKPAAETRPAPAHYVGEIVCHVECGCNCPITAVEWVGSKWVYAVANHRKATPFHRANPNYPTVR